MTDVDAAKQAVVEAALDEFTAHGFAAASLNSIIERAGISKGSFYYRYPSKEELYLSLIDHVIAARLEFLRQQACQQPALTADAGLLDILKTQAKLATEFTLSNPTFAKFTQRVTQDMQSQPLSAKIRERLSGQLDQTLLPLLRSAIGKGELRSDLGEAFIAKMLSHLLFSFGALFVPADSPPDREQIYADLDRYFDFIRNGIQSPEEQEKQEGRVRR